MAKRIIPRRKTRKPVKPTTHVVDGVELSPEQWALFQEKLAESSGHLIPRAGEQAKDLALRNTLYAGRPSTKVSDRFMPLFSRSSRASMALTALKDFPFYNDDWELIGLGNAIIGHCAKELFAVAMELNSMNEAIAKEIATEVAHG
ncbi:MAG: hypothetical protein QOI88_3368 [Gammaproteobacteria bacterium]|jgi:hypothetical protein|nr:hypothetical protein [Gammaproteobacteria bacterium]